MKSFFNLRYLLAFASVATATLTRRLLDNWLHDDAPLLIFVLAVMVAGRYGGVGPALVATALSILAGDYFFIPPRGTLGALTVEDRTRVLVFSLECIAVALVTEQLRRAYARSLEMTRQVRQHRDELATAVADRTAELQASNDALQAFVYSMSHDLRAPLRAMSGFSQAVLEDHDDSLPETARDYLNRVVNAGRRMERLIDRLLTYNRLTRSAVTVANEPVSLDVLVADVLRELKSEIRASGAQIEVVAPLHPVMAHEETMRQVVVNLVSNAVKFTRPGEQPIVRIRTEQFVSAGQLLTRLHVEDRGMGIAEQDRGRVFQPFERTAHTQAGSGLGLAIVARGVQRMGGQVGITDVPGGGSDFWIVLRAAASEAA